MTDARPAAPTVHPIRRVVVSHVTASRGEEIRQRAVGFAEALIMGSPNNDPEEDIVQACITLGILATAFDFLAEGTAQKAKEQVEKIRELRNEVGGLRFMLQLAKDEMSDQQREIADLKAANEKLVAIMGA